MKKSTLTIIHILLVFATFVTVLRSNQNSVEMIPYRLLPAYGGDCHIEIEIINPVTMGGMVQIHAEETEEIIIDRIIYEMTNPFANNEIFIIDGNYFYLLRVPYTGALWHGE